MRYGYEGGQEVFGCAVDRDESLFVSFEGNTSRTHVSKKPKVKGMWTPSICTCGYQPKAADATWVDDYQVLHVRCYECGCEWVE